MAKAIAVTQALAADAYSETEVYVEGIVSDMGKGIDLSFGNATFYISDDGETANQFYIYRLLDVGGAKFTDVNRFKKGDKVLLYGKLQNYKGNTPELAQEFIREQIEEVRRQVGDKSSSRLYESQHRRPCRQICGRQRQLQYQFEYVLDGKQRQRRIQCQPCQWPRRCQRQCQLRRKYHPVRACRRHYRGRR